MNVVKDFEVMDEVAKIDHPDLTSLGKQVLLDQQAGVEQMLCSCLD